MYSFCCHGVFIIKMKFAVNLVNNKVVYNLLILLVLNLYGDRTNGLRVIVVRSLLLDLLVLWIDLKD